MRKLITTITAVTALAACMAPAASAHADGVQQHKDNPAAQQSRPTGTDDHIAGFDGFWAWQQGAVRNITAHSAEMTLGFNKTFFKAPSPGIVGVEVYRADLDGHPWESFGDKSVLFTTHNEYYDVSVQDSTDPDKGNRPLTAGTTYRYRVFVEYNFGRDYSPEGTFTTAR